MLARIAALLVLCFFYSCTPIKKQDSSASSVVLDKGPRWSKPKAIPLCWMNPESLDPAVLSDLKAYAIREFSKTNIAFARWDACTPADARKRVIRVWFAPTYKWTATGAMTAGGGLSFLGPVADSLGGEDGPGTMKIDFSENGKYAPGRNKDFSVNETRATFIHELGHAVGLAHEHERKDGPKCGDQVRTIGREDKEYVFVGSYDPDSIMNYCQTPGLYVLSKGDVAGVNFLYPSVK